MKCWLCSKSVSLGYIDNPFQEDTVVCSKCADCLELSFDIERPSAARLMDEIGRKTSLSILQTEERWMQHKITVFQAISAAAFVDEEVTALEERIAALDRSWEEQPSHTLDFSNIENPYFWAVYHKAGADAQAVLDTAVRMALDLNQSLSSLHVLRSLIAGNQERVARTALLLAGLKPQSAIRALSLNLRGRVGTDDSLEIMEELSKSLEQWLSSWHESFDHSGSLLSALIGSGSLAGEFLSECCHMDTLTEILSKLKSTR